MTIVNKRVGVVTDCHLSEVGSPDGFFNNPVRLGRSRKLLRCALEWLRPQADMIIFLGDLSQAARSPDYDFLLETLSAVNLPCYAVPGNHDFVLGEKSANSVLQRAVNQCSEPSLAILGTGNVDHDDWLVAPTLVSEGSTFRLNYRLAPSVGPVSLVASHFPVLSMRNEIEAEGWKYGGDLSNRRDVERDLHHVPIPVVVLSGHLHVRGHSIAGNILQLSMAALVEAPHDVALVSIDADEEHVDVERLARPSPDFNERAPAVLDPALVRFRWIRGAWSRQL